MNTGLEDLGTDENESGSAKHENGTQRPRYRRKCARERKTRKRDSTHTVPLKTNSGAQNLKIRLDALGTAEYEFGNAKHENRT
jgi:hypothetical protein